MKKLKHFLNHALAKFPLIPFESTISIPEKQHAVCPLPIANCQLPPAPCPLPPAPCLLPIAPSPHPPTGSIK